MADEMDLSPCIGIVCQLGRKLLHPVFPADANTGRNGPAHRLGIIHLGSCAEGNLPRFPPGCPGSGGDFFQNFFHIFFNRHRRFPFCIRQKAAESLRRLISGTVGDAPYRLGAAAFRGRIGARVEMACL